MTTRIRLRRGHAAEWAATNPVLLSGEAGVDIDSHRMKLGDGVTTWTGLPYADVSSLTAFLAGAPAGLNEWLELTAAIEADQSGLAALTTTVAGAVAGIADVIAPAATGVAATDTANLAAAIAATPAGGTLRLRAGTYLLNAALSRSTSITIEGVAATANFQGHAAGGGAYYPLTPYLRGTVLKQTVAATDILQFPGSGMSPNLRNLALVFADGLATTGHGIYSNPPAWAGAQDNGIEDFRWDNVHVYGHDGNHYGMYLVNPLLGTVTHFRSHGGGGIAIVANHNDDSPGNTVFIHPYVVLSKAGTANGLTHSGMTAGFGAGTLNFLTYIRPQVNCIGAGQNGTQYTVDDRAGAGVAWDVHLISPDFESGVSNGGPNPHRLSPSTVISGAVNIAGYNYAHTSVGRDSAPYSVTAPSVAFGGVALKANTTGLRNTAVGASALTANTTGNDNTAVGGNALATNISGISNTAVGSLALRLTTGSNNTALGTNAGTSLTTGPDCTYIGSSAGFSNQTAQRCVAVGSFAAYYNTGDKNTALGAYALFGASGATGINNTAIGYGAGYSPVGNPAFAVTTGNHCTYIGYNTGPTSATQPDRATAIGYHAQAGSAGNSLAIGALTSASGIGSVAIGTDSGGTGASSTATDKIALGTALHTTYMIGSVSIAGAAKSLGFYGTTPIAKQTGVAVTDAAIHAALVALGLIAA